MKLNDKQLNVIKNVLNLFERQEARDTRVIHISGGFVHADMFNYDDEAIDIELKWGVKSDCVDEMHTEHYRLPIEIIDNDNLPVFEKVKHITD
jgi:hypothetical protein